MSRVGVDRVLKFAFELARSTPKKHLTSATKSNGIAITMPYWDERVKEMAKAYPDVKWNQFHVPSPGAWGVASTRGCSTKESSVSLRMRYCPACKSSGNTKLPTRSRCSAVT